MATRVTCPGCRQPLQIADGIVQPWVTCPRCLARVANPQAHTADGPDDLSVDPEVQRDARKTRWLLIVLAGIGALTLLHLAVVVLSSTPSESHGYGPKDAKQVAAVFVSNRLASTEELLVLGLGVGLVTALSAAYVLWRRPGQTPLETAGRVVTGTLVLVGAIVAGVIVIGIAVVVFVFALCATGVLR